MPAISSIRSNDLTKTCTFGVQVFLFNHMEEDRYNSLREKLDQHYAWPALYLFKFIVPKGSEDELRRLFPSNDVREKASANGNYTSFSIQMMCNSSEAIIEVYKKVEHVEGLIAL